MKKIAFVALVTASLLASIKVAASESESLLVGTWVLCHDPDNGPKEILEFFPEGYGFNVRPNKPKYPFLFKQALSQVLILASPKGNLVTIYLSVNSDVSRLTYKSDRTEAEAFYVRQGQETVNSCTVK